MFSDVTKFESISCEIEWKLYDFDKHAEFMQHGQFLTSKQFYNPKYPSVKWELRIYPALNPLGYGSNLISLVQVGLKDSNDSLKAKFRINTLANNGDKLACCYNAIFNFKNQLESDKFQFHKPKTSDNSLTILCDVEFVPYNIKLENEFEDFLTTKNSFIDIYRQGILTDCVFEIGDEKINAHKCILAKYSIVFQTMFEQMGMSEAQNGKIKIVDSSPECFRAMLEYFYSGEIDKKTLEKHSYELFAISHKYEVEHLMEISESFMASKIDAANFSERCKYAELYCLPKIEKACINYFSANRETFILSNEWNEFKINNKDFAFRLLEEKQIYGKQIGKNQSNAEVPLNNKKRTVGRKGYKPEQREALENKFLQQRYLSLTERNEIALRIGLKTVQVKNWFQRRRMKCRREEIRRLM